MGIITVIVGVYIFVIIGPTKQLIDRPFGCGYSK